MRVSISALLGSAILVAACGDDGNATSSSTSSTGNGGASATSSNGASMGPGGLTSSSASSAAGPATTSSSSGPGGGDPGWAPIPWWDHACELEYATVPANALAPVTWTPCDFGEAGCSKLVKSWVPFTLTGQSLESVRRSASGYELGLFLFVDDGDNLVVATDGSGATMAAYRRPVGSDCGFAPLYVVDGGHWVGGVAGSDSTFVFQPSDVGPGTAMPSTLSRASQRDDAGDTILSIEWYAAAALEVYDRTRNRSFTLGPAPGSSFSQPRVNESSVFFMRADGVDDPTAWVWDRADGQFRELIGAGDKVVSDIRGDGQTMVWVETPQAIDAVGFPPGILYTAPFTTDPEAIVKTARWTDFPVPPSQLSVMGSGYYAAVAEALDQILILRVSDGRRWTIPIPANQFNSWVVSMPYIDDQVLFLSTDTDIHRIDLTALGEGTPE